MQRLQIFVELLWLYDYFMVYFQFSFNFNLLLGIFWLWMAINSKLWPVFQKKDQNDNFFVFCSASFFHLFGSVLDLWSVYWNVQGLVVWTKNGLPMALGTVSINLLLVCWSVCSFFAAYEIVIYRFRKQFVNLTHLNKTSETEWRSQKICTFWIFAVAPSNHCIKNSLESSKLNISDTNLAINHRKICLKSIITVTRLNSCASSFRCLLKSFLRLCLFSE